MYKPKKVQINNGTIFQKVAMINPILHYTIQPVKTASRSLSLRLWGVTPGLSELRRFHDCFWNI